MQELRVTVRELAEEVGISIGSGHSILTEDLTLRRVSAKFVPKLTQTFLAKHKFLVVRQAPYYPDMAPCDYWLFPHLKTQLKGTRFESRDIFAENKNATRAAYTLSLTRLLQATDAVCWQEKIHVCA
jgi:8-oxo-dGTP pyrophosphatase MutT (NUDIX family)